MRQAMTFRTHDGDRLRRLGSLGTVLFASLQTNTGRFRRTSLSLQAFRPCDAAQCLQIQG